VLLRAKAKTGCSHNLSITSIRHLLSTALSNRPALPRWNPTECRSEFCFEFLLRDVFDLRVGTEHSVTHIKSVSRGWFLIDVVRT